MGGEEPLRNYVMAWKQDLGSWGRAGNAERKGRAVLGAGGQERREGVYGEPPSQVLSVFLFA